MIVIFHYLEMRLIYICFNEYIDVSQQVDPHSFSELKIVFLNELLRFVLVDYMYFNWILGRWSELHIRMLNAFLNLIPFLSTTWKWSILTNWSCKYMMGVPQGRSYSNMNGAWCTQFALVLQKEFINTYSNNLQEL